MFNTVIIIICVLIFIGMIALDIFLIRYQGGKKDESKKEDNNENSVKK